MAGTPQEGLFERAILRTMARGDIPDTTVSRLPWYLHCLDQLTDRQETVSSEEIAAALNINGAQVRKDLWYLDCEGRRGVGYEVRSLVSQITAALGIESPLAIAIVGMGNLGIALAHYQGFANRGLRLTGLYDVDPAKVGVRVGDLVIRHTDRLPEDVAGSQVNIGIVATPAPVAQQVADLLVRVGVTSILNFAPIVLRVPEEATVRRVDVATELLILGFHQSETAQRVGSGQR